jgi:DNA-binding NtrC family response regulator
MSIDLHREAKPQPPRRPVWVLIVEDETLIRLLVADILRDAGFEVVTAAHAGEAVTILKSTDQIDYVFTDIMMPGVMNGIALAKWIKGHRPGLPVAFTSGVLRSKLAELGLMEEDAFFAKPVAFDRLVQHIGAAVSEIREMPGAAAGD